MRLPRRRRPDNAVSPRLERIAAPLGGGCTPFPRLMYSFAMKNRTERAPTVLLYSRVSTDDQANSGLGLADQRSILDAEALRRRWAEVRHVVDDGFSAKTLQRPGIAEALAALAAGQASALVVAKLDRLSRSLLDFCTLMERAQREGWQLIALDIGVDTSTPAGEMMANVMAAFAQYERRLIGQRTAAALAQRKRQGVRLGRPRTLPTDVVNRIYAMRQEGRSLRAIAKSLNGERVPTAQGGVQWHASTVRQVLRSVELDAAAVQAAQAA